MKPSHSSVATPILVAHALVLGAIIESPAAAPVVATPAKPAASAGLLNDWLREQFPAASEWDVGGQFRVRYESKENAG